MINPRSCGHSSVFPFEMTDIEPDDGEIPNRKLTWNPLKLLSHIMCRTIETDFLFHLWEV
jgi:hypothetical protein